MFVWCQSTHHVKEGHGGEFKTGIGEVKRNGDNHHLVGPCYPLVSGGEPVGRPAEWGGQVGFMDGSSDSGRSVGAKARWEVVDQKSGPVCVGADGADGATEGVESGGQGGAVGECGQGWH